MPLLYPTRLARRAISLAAMAICGRDVRIARGGRVCHRIAGGVTGDLGDRILAPEDDAELDIAPDHQHEQPDDQGELDHRLATPNGAGSRAEDDSSSHGAGTTSMRNERGRRNCEVTAAGVACPQAREVGETWRITGARWVSLIVTQATSSGPQGGQAPASMVHTTSTDSLDGGACGEWGVVGIDDEIRWIPQSPGGVAHQARLLRNESASVTGCGGETVAGFLQSLIGLPTGS